MVGDAIDSQMTNVNLSSNIMTFGSKTSGGAAILQIVVNTTGTPATLTWDGTNNSAADVTPASIRFNCIGIMDRTRQRISHGALSLWARGKRNGDRRTICVNYWSDPDHIQWNRHCERMGLKREGLHDRERIGKIRPGSPGTAMAQWNALG